MTTIRPARVAALTGRGVVALAAVGAGAAGALALTRGWWANWGATDAEATSALPGDELVPAPRASSTRAVTVGAPPAAVWPWLVQMGQGRGGLYSYTWLENLLGCDLHNADRIEPSLQHLVVGDIIRLVPEDYRVPLAFTVRALDPQRALVLAPAPEETREAAFDKGLPFPSWAFVLRPQDGGTRLVSRWRVDYSDAPWSRISNGLLTPPVEFFMERKMLLGIKARAERPTGMTGSIEATGGTGPTGPGVG